MSVLLTEQIGAVTVLKLNRPKRMNALGLPGDGVAIASACEAVNANHDIRCAIITGVGKSFSAGGDLTAMADPKGPFAGTVLDIYAQYRSNIQTIVRAIYSLQVPLIAAINGPAVGLGCDIACMADIRIASEKARFAVNFLRVGLVPGDGGSWLLPRSIGASRASELLFCGDFIDASTAERWGLISRVVPEGSLLDEAIATARRICEMPPHSLRLTKSLIRQAATSTFDAALEQAATAQVVAHSTEDFKNGVTAALHKRSATFHGR